jgi:hypothetical protein
MAITIVSWAQVTDITIPDPDNPTASINVQLPNGVNLPVGFNSGGAFVLILMIMTGLIKKVPQVKTFLETLLPKQKNAVVICIVFSAGQIAGWISVLMNLYLGIPTPITPNQLFISALGFSGFAVACHSILIGGIYKGFLKVSVFPKLSSKKT